MAGSKTGRNPFFEVSIEPMKSTHNNAFWRNATGPDAILAMVAALAFLYASYIAISYSTQIPLDLHSFRQTQTALTSLWFMKEGYQLAYQTPVGGAPWSIPFEFPLYQAIVAMASQATHLSLDACGRLVSFMFLVLCLIPARGIVRHLELSPNVWRVFAALLLSCPLYLYWGRTFMIETTAIFFAVAAIRYFLDLLQGRSSKLSIVLFVLCMSLSILQKATTGAGVLAILGVCYFCSIVARYKSDPAQGIALIGERITVGALCFGIPLAIGVAWTNYTDHVKEMNQLGVHLTSSALHAWNWGTLSQKLSLPIFVDVLWGRIFQQNLGSFFGLAALGFTAFSKAKKNVKLVVLVATAMGIVPLFLFTNLHLVHSYYQTANVIFLIFALSVALGHIVGQTCERKDLLVVLTLVLVGYSYFQFNLEFMPFVKKEYTADNSRDVAVAEILKRELPEQKEFVAFGNDWSSSIAYLSERKSFNVPDWLQDYEARAANPNGFIGADKLGAVVKCPHDRPTLKELFQWADAHGSWRWGSVQGCVIGLPEQPIATGTVAPIAQCEGSLDAVKVTPDGASLVVDGWTKVSGERGGIAEKTYVTLSKDGESVMYFEALRVTRQALVGTGFSRVIDASKLTGVYTVGMARFGHGHLAQCQFQIRVPVNNSAAEH